MGKLCYRVVVTITLFITLLASHSICQTPIITTRLTQISSYAMCEDGNGNVFICGRYNIYKLDKNNSLSKYAGNGSDGFSGDGGPATNAALNFPYGICLDPAGNLYIADYYNQRVRKVSTNGIITTVAGNGSSFYSSSGTATAIGIGSPTDVKFDNLGKMYILTSSCLYKGDPGGTITVIAGNVNSVGFSGDGGPAISALLSSPKALYIDASRNIFIADEGNNRVRKINTSGVISTYGGNGSASGNAGDGGPATSATIADPRGICGDASGNIFASNTGGYTIKKINSSGTISTYAGTGISGYSGDGGPATAARLGFPTGLFIDDQGALLFSDGANLAIRQVCTPTSQPSTITGNATVCQPGSSLTYSVASVIGAASYTWSLPSGWSGSSTTNSITCTAGNAGGIISVTANNACGTSTARTLSVTVKTIPVKPSGITGAKTICASSQNITYSVTSDPNVTAYTWSLPNGWTGTSETNSITTNIGSEGGTLSVTGTNSCGSSSVTTAAITVNPLPPALGNVKGDFAPCGGTVQIYSVDRPASAVTRYKWAIPTGWHFVSSDTGIQVEVVPNNYTGHVYVIDYLGTCTNGSPLLFSQPIVNSDIPAYNTSKYQDVNKSQQYIDNGCREICTINPTGTNPVKGMINCENVMENSVPTYSNQPFLQRHYNIFPDDNSDSSTAIILLHFRQEEFDAYNSARGNSLPLPANPTDSAAFPNVRLIQFRGTGTAPGNYTGDTVSIDLLPGNFSWDSYRNGWGVLVDVKGFGGFYVTTPIAYTFVGNGNFSDPSNWSNSAIPPSVLPAGAEVIINPTGTDCFLDVPLTLSNGKLTIMPGKNLVITSGLIINEK